MKGIKRDCGSGLFLFFGVSLMLGVSEDRADCKSADILVFDMRYEQRISIVSQYLFRPHSVETLHATSLHPSQTAANSSL